MGTCSIVSQFTGSVSGICASMAPRPNWKAYLKLSLVSCPVALYPPTSTSQRLRFNIINRETSNRIRNEVVDVETGDPVPLKAMSTRKANMC